MSVFDWLRAGHIVAMIAWMAAMLMYPRLLVYRLEGAGNGGLEAAMDAGAARLRRLIMTPSLLLTWLFGLGLVGHNWDYYQSAPWFWGKIVLVIALSAMHGYLVSIGRKVAAGERPVEPKTLRMMNELPFVIAILAVILVVVEPRFG
ncbi:hypothetical protein GC169_10405 [bacterium]|nr:hypothetical protein [bacterium]